MADDLKNMIEINIRSYDASIRTYISWMRRDLDGLEVMGNKLIESNDWEDLMGVLHYLEELQDDSERCNDLINRAIENRELLKQYSERYGSDE